MTNFDFTHENVLFTNQKTKLLTEVDGVNSKEAPVAGNCIKVNEADI